MPPSRASHGGVPAAAAGGAPGWPGGGWGGGAGPPRRRAGGGGGVSGGGGGGGGAGPAGPGGVGGGGVQPGGGVVLQDRDGVAEGFLRAGQPRGGLLAGGRARGVAGGVAGGGVPDHRQLHRGVTGQGERVVVGGDVIRHRAGVTGAGRAVLGLDVDIAGQARPGGDPDVQPARRPGLRGQGDVDTAGALHVDDQHRAGLPGRLDDAAERFLPAGALLQEPPRVHRRVRHPGRVQPLRQLGDQVVAVRQDQLRPPPAPPPAACMPAASAVIASSLAARPALT